MTDGSCFRKSYASNIIGLNPILLWVLKNYVKNLFSDI